MSIPKETFNGDNHQLLERLLQENLSIDGKISQMNTILLTLVAQLEPILKMESGGMVTRISLAERDLIQFRIWKEEIDREKQRLLIWIIATLLAALVALGKSFLK